MTADPLRLENERLKRENQMLHDQCQRLAARIRQAYADGWTGKRMSR